VAELSGRTVVYGYDDLYRLKTETVSPAIGGTFTCGDKGENCGAIGYTYDAVGNRQQRTSTLPKIPATGLLNYDENDRIKPDVYDDNGNTLSDGIENAYDFEDHLIKRGDVTVVYDGDGNRVAEATGAGTTQYLVDTLNPTGYAQVIEELQGGKVARTYTWGLSLIAQNRQPDTADGQLSFYGYDGHGSVRYLTDSVGAITDKYDYDAFGTLINQTGSTPNNYLFAGEQYDDPLKLYYNRARYLDVRTGRFWGMDKYEGDSMSPRSLHKYLYTGSDPVNGRDPSGRTDLIDINLTVALYSGLTSMAAVTAFGAYAAVGTMLNIPKDFKTQIMKPPSAAVVGVSATANVGELLNNLGAGETSIGAGAVVGLQFLSLGGGFEALVPTTRDRIWMYSFFGAFYSVPFGHYGPNGLSSDITGLAIWPGVNASFVDASLYLGAVWNLKNPQDYAGPFYCTSGSLLLGFIGVRLSPNATLCSAENGVFSVTSDVTGIAGGGAKSSAGSSLTKYQFQGELPRRREEQ
jgi:RHS repeat-associated protein